MKKLMLAAVALAALAPLAWAETGGSMPTGIGAQTKMAQADVPPPPPPPPGGPHGHGGPGGPGMMPPPPPPPPRGPHIRLERGDMALDVNCGEAETLKSCTETASQLIDKLANLPVKSAQAGAPAAAGAGAATTPSTPPNPGN